MTKIRAGSRGSKLALIQTEIIKNLLAEVDPSLEIEIKVITTQGDVNMSPVPLDSVGKGWFTKELDKELLAGNIDLAVHSLKDLPEVLPSGLVIVAIPEREDPREALVSKAGVLLEDLPEGAIIGTDSTRRKSQIIHRRGDLVVKSVRGNVITRLEKLKTQEYDALFLAVAGLKRLGLEDRITQYFEANDFIPSPGQGALAVVTHEDNKELISLLDKLNHKESVAAVEAERTFSIAIGGGCKMPVGAYAQCQEDEITIYAFVGSLDGTASVKDSISGPIDKPAELGKKLAEQLLIKSQEWWTHARKR